jgi:hypothetical protein
MMAIGSKGISAALLIVFGGSVVEKAEAVAPASAFAGYHKITSPINRARNGKKKCFVSGPIYDMSNTVTPT